MTTQATAPVFNIVHFLAPNCTLNRVCVSSKKKALEQAAKTLANHHIQLNEDALFEGFVQREKLGTTAIGHGCAIPHCRADQIDQVYGCFLKLNAPIDFDAPDHENVDLLFALVVPRDATDTHLNALAAIAEALHNESFLNNLRKTKTDEELYHLLTK